MSRDTNLEHPETTQKKKKKNSSLKPKKKEQKKQIAIFAELKDEINKIDLEKPKAFEDAISLFDVLRSLKDLTNNQIEEYFEIHKDKLVGLWIPFLTKISTNLLQGKCENDNKLIVAIRSACKKHLDEYGILETSLTCAEKNVCLLCDGKFVTQFLREAQQQNKKHGKQIANADLACMSFICFSLYCKQSYEGDLKIQHAIDRAIAEYFSSREMSDIREKDLVGRTLGSVLSAKVYSPKRISELTYLYAGTTGEMEALTENVKRLEEMRRNQLERIASLSDQIKSINSENHDLQKEVAILGSEVQRLKDERDAAENMLEYEKNKFSNLLQSQKSGLAQQLSADIAREMEALRGLLEYLDEADQKRIRRRLDRIDGYLEDFGGGQ
jgi:hypothetical protein